jgi:hypothetical protein
VKTVEGDEFKVVEDSGLINVGCVRTLKYLAEGYIYKGQAKLIDRS